MQELFKLFYELSLHPKNANELKGLIIQLAIQGKLTGSKSSKKSSVGEIIEFTKNGFSGRPNKDGKGVKRLGIETVTQTAFIEINESMSKFIEIPNEKKIKYYVKNKDIFLCRQNGNLNFVGKAGVYHGENDKLIFSDSLIQIRPNSSIIDSSYLCIFINSKTARYQLDQFCSTTAGNYSINGTNLKKVMVPIFTIEEQKEIVNIVNKLFKEVEGLENLTENRIELKKDYATSALSQLAKNDSKAEWQALKPQFHDFFNEIDNVKKLRETILQLAVQGKLTAKWRAQNPELISGENSAENLLKEIKAEKAKLIKAKKIKKEKALPSFTEDEIPFELPDGWVWCRVGNILENLSDYHANGSYKTLKKHTKLLDEENYAIMLRTTNFHEKNRYNYKYITEDAYNFLEKSKLYPGDIIMNKIGDPGTVFWVDDRGKPMSLAMNLFLLRAPSHGKLNRILYLYLIGNESYVKSFAAGTSTQTITKDAVKELVFPLAPLNEHDVIVEKVNSLMVLCDQLEQEIENRQKQIEDLMQSVLKEVLEREKELKENLMTTET